MWRKIIWKLHFHNKMLTVYIIQCSFYFEMLAQNAHALRRHCDYVNLMSRGR